MTNEETDLFPYVNKDTNEKWRGKIQNETEKRTKVVWSVVRNRFSMPITNLWHRKCDIY